jgi:hypothetical protein
MFRDADISFLKKNDYKFELINFIVKKELKPETRISFIEVLVFSRINPN